MSLARSLSKDELASSKRYQAVGCQKGSIPQELIAFEAYCRWLQRCQLHGRIVHGGDRIDWLEAELELVDLWGELTAEDIEQFFEESHRNTLVPSRDRISLRAYYKSLSSDDHSAKRSEQRWIEAETEEKILLFAQSFHRFLAQRRRAPNRFGRLIHRN